MSYSRWINSKWYIFPSTSKCIEVWRAGDECLNWQPTETYEQFLDKAANTLLHDKYYTEDFMTMKKILEKNIDDINKWFKKWKTGQD